MAIIQGNAKQGSTRGFYPKIINGSLRFNDDDSAYLTITPSTDGTSLDTQTFSFWVKRANLGSSQFIIGGQVGGSYSAEIGFNPNDTFSFYTGEGKNLTTNQVFRDPSAWYHFVAVYDSTQATDSNRLKLYVNGEQITSFSNATYPTQNTDSEIMKSGVPTRIGAKHTPANHFDGYLANVHFIDGQALTASDFGETKNGVWVAKDYAGTFGTNGFYLTFEDDTEVEAFNTVLWTGDGVGTYNPKTGVGFSPDLVWIKNRDGANHHLLFDTVRGAGSRSELSSNNTTAEGGLSLQGYDWLSSFDSDGFTTTWSGSNIPYYTDQSGYKYAAWCWDAGANNAVTGHSSVTYTGNGGTQKISGFPFSPDLVWIKQRNVNNENTLQNTVTGATKGLISNSTGAEFTIAEGLKSFDSDGFVVGSNVNWNQSGGTYVAWAWDAGDGDPVSNTAGSITSTVKASTTNGFSIVSWQANNQTVSTVGHGLSQAPDLVIIKNRSSSTNAQWVVGHSGFGFNGQGYLNLNGAFGTNSGSFNNTAPTSTVFTVGTDQTVNLGTNNYIAYCFHDVTSKQKFGSYTGQGNVTLGFRPGFILIKNTTDSATDWVLYDASRNPLGGTAILRPNLNNAEANETVTITANGFTTGTGSYVGASGKTYIYAAFAGSYSDYITDYNTDGSIDSRVKASDTTGFSIVSYTGTGANATVGHGLSSAPDMVIVKTRDSALDWPVFHTSLGGGNYVKLNTTNASTSAGAVWNSTAPTNSVISIGTNTQTNTSGDNYIAYCWSETTGYSKFGSYTGNGSTDGPEVTCGFKPAFVIVKRTDSASGNGWYMWDGTRTTTNPIHNTLIANISGAEDSTSEDVNFLADGFKLLRTYGDFNASGGTYIYAAFADTREAAFWLDQSGNDNDWQPVNLDHNDTVADSPTNNFATLNPLQVATSGAPTFSDGNLQVSTPVSGAGNAVSTIGVTSGKYYAEITIKSLATLNRANVGITGDASATITANTNIGSLTSGLDVGYFYNGTSFTNNVETAGYGDSYGVGDVIGVALNADDSQVTFYKNGVSQGAISFTSGGTYHFAVGDVSAGGGNTFECNFGQQPFKYDPPA